MFKRISERLIMSIISIFLILMVVFAIWQVFTRYVLNSPSQITDELLRFLMIWLVYLGVPFAFSITDKHMSLTIIKDKFKGNLRLIVETFNYLVVILFSGIILVKGGMIQVNLGVGQFSDSLNLPMNIVYMIIPISGVLSIIFKTINYAQVYKEIKESSNGC